LKDPNDTEDDYAADVESDVEQGNGIEEPECPELWDMSAAPNVPGLIRPKRKSTRLDERLFSTVNGMETRRNKAVKKK
jgi:hypothetical protein